MNYRLLPLGLGVTEWNKVVWGVRSHERFIFSTFKPPDFWNSAGCHYIVLFFFIGKHDMLLMCDIISAFIWCFGVVSLAALTVCDNCSLKINSIRRTCPSVSRQGGSLSARKLWAVILSFLNRHIAETLHRLWVLGWLLISVFLSLKEYLPMLLKPQGKLFWTTRN